MGVLHFGLEAAQLKHVADREEVLSELFGVFSQHIFQLNIFVGCINPITIHTIVLIDSIGI